MSYEQGYHYLQVDSNDKSKVEKFRAVSRHKKKTDADKRAERERNKGKRARKIHEDGYWIVYTRG